VTADAGVEDLLRELAPRVLGVLVRRSEDFAVREDAVQEALVAAAQLQAPRHGCASARHRRRSARVLGRAA
jgi:predicted RNA polymerase sigma factor